MSVELEIPQVQEENKIEAGTILMQKRKELGLSQQQIADRLRLRRSIIENIESNQFESEQVATFTRGYLRSYARVVGIDESVVLCALDDCGEAQHQEHEMQSFSHKTNKQKHDSRLMSLTWGIGAIVVGISVFLWWQNQEKSVLELTTLTLQEEQVEQELADNQALDFSALEPNTNHDAVDPDTLIEQPLEEVTSTVMPSQPQSAEKAISDAATMTEPQDPQTASIPVSATPTVEAVAQPEQPPRNVSEVTTNESVETSAAEVVASLLEMTFSDDCWVQVKDATGKTLATGIKKAGQDLKLSGEAPYNVILGAPESVSIILSSEPVDLSGYTSGKVARFTLP
ncbi:cytoskeleton protein RodZ [Vibrio ostreicida]|uniref:cytoskeleton protein RodZ n=1 Tax=Vibrio ostreicida TaxID=526588 RepID=UPI003B5C48AA